MGYFPTKSKGEAVSRRAALGDDTTASTSWEAWGATTITFQEEWFDGPITIEADLVGFFIDVDANEFASFRIEVSTDGGSTFSSTGSSACVHSSSTGATTTDDRIPGAANYLRANVTPTGDIVVRGAIYTPNSAGAASFGSGTLVATIRPANANDNVA